MKHINFETILNIWDLIYTKPKNIQSMSEPHTETIHPELH